MYSIGKQVMHSGVYIHVGGPKGNKLQVFVKY